MQCSFGLATSCEPGSLLAGGLRSHRKAAVSAMAAITNTPQLGCSECCHAVEGCKTCRPPLESPKSPGNSPKWTPDRDTVPNAPDSHISSCPSGAARGKMPYEQETEGSGFKQEKSSPAASSDDKPSAIATVVNEALAAAPSAYATRRSSSAPIAPLDEPERLVQPSHAHSSGDHGF